MREGATHFIGTHDFATFSNANKPRPENTTRTVHRIDIIQEGEVLRFEIEGNNFLYKMVRNLVGTLIYYGAGKTRIDRFPSDITRPDTRWNHSSGTWPHTKNKSITPKCYLFSL